MDMDTPEKNPAWPHLPIRPDWLARGREEILEPDLPIVDPHHHLWDRPGNRYLLDELLADAGSGHNLVATVFVECRAMYRARGNPDMRSVGETEFVAGIAAMSASGIYGPVRACDVIVGNAPLLLGDRARPVLEALVQAGGGRFRGIRNVSAWHADERVRSTTANAPQGMLVDPTFRAGFAHLAPLGLSFDAWLYHTQLDELLDLARAFPGTTIVLDHVGGPIGVGPYAGRRDEVFADWKGRIQALARCTNVHVKLGGLGMRLFGFDFATKAEPPTSEALAAAWRPYVETCIEAFGAGRCMFESNFPVDKGTCSYPAIWNAFKRIASGASAAEKASLFAGTATAVYRLPL